MMQVYLDIPDSQIKKISEVFDCKPTELTKILESMILDWLVEKTNYSATQTKLF
jgi:hypothetical protein